MQKAVVDFLNFLLLRCLNLLGNRVKVHFEETFPARPYANLCFKSSKHLRHTAANLVFTPLLSAFCRQKELGKGLPSISFHLREGQCSHRPKKTHRLLRPSLNLHSGFTKKDGRLLFFPEVPPEMDSQKIPTRGLNNPITAAADALLVPISISHSWKLAQWNYFPML